MLSKQISWNEGLNKYTDERMRKISESLKGHFVSKETRAKISKAKTNPSEEIRRKISLGHADVSGENNPNWGKVCSQETRDKIGKANKGKKRTIDMRIRASKLLKGKKKSETWRKKMSIRMRGPANLWRGKKHTEEARRKISEAQRGEKGSNWRGGVTPLYKSIRSCVIYALWRNAIFHKDKFQCQDCGDRVGGNLVAHHIYPFIRLLEDNHIQSLGQAVRVKELWDINNGITLCEKCHKARHKQSGYKPYLYREELYAAKEKNLYWGTVPG